MTGCIRGRGPQISGVAGVFLALCTITIVLRCYCRVVVVRSFGVDDWAALISLIFFILFCGFVITGVYYGTGQHIDTLPLAEILAGIKWWWACEPVYVLSNMALKFSIGIMLLRISVYRAHMYIIWTVIILIELYSFAYFLLFILQCRPSSYFWTRYTGGKGTCMAPHVTINATYAYSAITCIFDWILGLLPISLVWNLQMNMRTKISVAVILALGAVASTATIVRIPYVKDLNNEEEDFLYAITNVVILSISETGIGIIASSIATLGPLFRTFYSRNQLSGDTSSQADSNSWPQPQNICDIMGRRKAEAEGVGLGLRGVTLTPSITARIVCGRDLERGGPKLRRSASAHSLGQRSTMAISDGQSTSTARSWTDSESRCNDDPSEDGSTADIRKSTLSTLSAQDIR